MNKCPSCKKENLVLITGDYGIYLDQPYYKCIDCGENFSIEQIKNT